MFWLTLLVVNYRQNFENPIELEIPNQMAFKEVSNDELPICQKNIVIPESIKSIPDGKYWDCKEVVTLELKEGLVEIGIHLFQGCSNLEGSLVIPKSVRKISDQAFYLCSKISSLTLHNDIEYLGQSSFWSCIGITGTIEIPVKLTEIKKWTFGKTSISSFVFGPDVTSILEGAFMMNPIITSFTIPDTVTSIGVDIFKECINLKEIVFSDKLNTISATAFKGCINLEGPLIFPPSINTISNNAFEGCTKLGGSLVIPSTITNIGTSAFIGTSFSKITYEGKTQPTCTNAFPEISETYSPEVYVPTDFDQNNFCGLPITTKITDELPICQKNIVIPESVKSIPDGKYWDCKEVVTLELKEGLVEIGQHSFQGCSNLKGSLVIPKSVRKISDQAFYLCSKISSLTLHNDIEYLGQSSFWSCIGITGTIEIPVKLTEIKKWTFGKTSISSFVFGPDVTSILEGAFMMNPIITSFTIPDTVTSIGVDIFKECINLKEIVFSDKLNTISATAFKGCINLEGPLIFPPSINTISNNAFEGCTKLGGSLVIPSTIINIGTSAFIGTSFSKITYEGKTHPTCTNAFPEISETYSPEVYVPTDFDQNNFCGLPITTKITESISMPDENGSDSNEYSSDSNEYSSDSNENTSESNDNISDSNENGSDSYESSTEIIETPFPNYEEDPPVENQETTSNIIEIIDSGYMSQEVDEKDLTKKNISEAPNTIKTITFTNKNVKITENRDRLSLEPLYFVASQKNSEITIDNNVNKSIVGISTENTPTVLVGKGSIPVSFLNNLTTGNVDISFQSSESFTRLNLKDVDNRRGSFSLSVPSSVQIVSFSTIWMFRESHFEITRKQNNAHYLDDSNEDILIIVEDLVDISSNSKSTLKDTALHGKLRLYDDSSLNMIGKSNISENSEINLIFKKSWKDHPEKPVIKIESPLNNIFSKIVLSSYDNNILDVVDFPIIGSDSFTSCNELGQKIQLKNGKKDGISYKCNNNKGNSFLSVTVKEKFEKNKLSGGAIAGIVIASVVVLAAIIALIIFYAKCNKHDESDDEQDDDIDVSEIQI